MSNKDLMQFIEEIIAPDKMTIEEAVEFLEDLMEDIGSRVDALKEDIARTQR